MTAFSTFWLLLSIQAVIPWRYYVGVGYLLLAPGPTIPPPTCSIGGVGWPHITTRCYDGEVCLLLTVLLFCCWFVHITLFPLRSRYDSRWLRRYTLFATPVGVVTEHTFTYHYLTFHWRFPTYLLHDLRYLRRCSRLFCWSRFLIRCYSRSDFVDPHIFDSIPHITVIYTVTHMTIHRYRSRLHTRFTHLHTPRVYHLLRLRLHLPFGCYIRWYTVTHAFVAFWFCCCPLPIAFVVVGVPHDLRCCPIPDIVDPTHYHTYTHTYISHHYVQTHYGPRLVPIYGEFPTPVWLRCLHCCLLRSDVAVDVVHVRSLMRCVDLRCSVDWFPYRYTLFVDYDLDYTVGVDSPHTHLFVVVPVTFLGPLFALLLGVGVPRTTLRSVLDTRVCHTHFIPPPHVHVVVLPPSTFHHYALQSSPLHVVGRFPHHYARYPAVRDWLRYVVTDRSRPHFTYTRYCRYHTHILPSHRYAFTIPRFSPSHHDSPPTHLPRSRWATDTDCAALLRCDSRYVTVTTAIVLVVVVGRCGDYALPPRTEYSVLLTGSVFRFTMTLI